MSVTMNQTCAENIPAPHTPCISTSIGQRFDVYDNLATEIFSRPSAISLTDSQLSSCSKREEISFKQKPWLDLSFLAGASSQEDGYTVPDEQDTYLGRFRDHAPSCLKFPRVQPHRQSYDDCSWQPGGWHRGETGAQWRIGHVMSKVPNEVQIGGGDVFVQSEGQRIPCSHWGPVPQPTKESAPRARSKASSTTLTRRNALYKTRRSIVSHLGKLGRGYPSSKSQPFK